MSLSCLWYLLQGTASKECSFSLSAQSSTANTKLSRVRKMSSRVLARFVSRRFSSNGKILSEEEKAAENVYIKKMEKEKLEKLARKGPNPEEKPPTGSGDSGSAYEAKATGQTSSNSGASTDKNRNYVLLAGVAAGLGALGWYVQSKKKPEEVQD